MLIKILMFRLLVIIISIIVFYSKNIYAFQSNIKCSLTFQDYENDNLIVSHTMFKKFNNLKFINIDFISNSINHWKINKIYLENNIEEIGEMLVQEELNTKSSREQKALEVEFKDKETH